MAKVRKENGLEPFTKLQYEKAQRWETCVSRGVKGVAFDSDGVPSDKDLLNLEEFFGWAVMAGDIPHAEKMLRQIEIRLDRE